MIVQFGLQGGVGSFNEEALISHLGEKSAEFKFFGSSLRTLEALHAEKVQYAHIALSNSLAGEVVESRDALTAFPCELVESYIFQVSFCLLARKDVFLKDIKKIIAHSHAIAQCMPTLKKILPNAEFISGEGEGLHHAEVARRLYEGTLDSCVATVGSRRLGSLYSLDIVQEKIESQESFTQFGIFKKQTTNTF